MSDVGFPGDQFFLLVFLVNDKDQQKCSAKYIPKQTRDITGYQMVC